MSSLKTEHYQLHKWEKDDAVLRAEFNENFGGIDSVLAGKAEIVAGTYTGDGAESRTIELGFCPQAVLVMSQNGGAYYANHIQGGLAMRNAPTFYSTPGGGTVLEVTESGFRVYSRSLSNYHMAETNLSNFSYRYLAVR